MEEDGGEQVGPDRRDQHHDIVDEARGRERGQRRRPRSHERSPLCSFRLARRLRQFQSHAAWCSQGTQSTDRCTAEDRPLQRCVLLRPHGHGHHRKGSQENDEHVDQEVSPNGSGHESGPQPVGKISRSAPAPRAANRAPARKTAKRSANKAVRRAPVNRPAKRASARKAAKLSAKKAVRRA
jgi:hypothetical protein